MAIKQKIFNIFAILLENLVPVVSIITDAGSIKFYCPNSTCLWRAKTLLSKEPETIEWINTFDKGSIFWDIGANVGIYSLYAALRPGIKIFAFEPFASNYYILNKNIIVNGKHDCVHALCVAFSDKTDLSCLNISNTEIGSALHYIGKSMNESEKKPHAVIKQGMISLSIDDFVDGFKPPFPNYIKIDVDGAESSIVHGAAKTFSDKRLKSILIEMDSADERRCNDIDGFLKKSGMKLSHKRHASIFDSGEYKSGYNYIYERV